MCFQGKCFVVKSGFREKILGQRRGGLVDDGNNSELFWNWRNISCGNEKNWIGDFWFRGQKIWGIFG